MSRFLFDQIDDLEARYRDARRRNDADAGWRILREAARIMYMLANRAEGRDREARLGRADAWVEKAAELKEKGAFPRRERPEKEAGEEEEGEKSDFLLGERPDVGFEDIAGLEDAKEEIRIRMVYPFTHPEIAQKYGIRKGGGLLLYGPPGTGKTLLARAVAGEIDAAFFTVKPSEIMSKWVGEAEQNIERLFKNAREHPRSVVFIDEVEALVPRRSGSQSSVMKRVVPQILAELEGIDKKSEGALLFIGATNEPWSLDPAVVRPGRFDAKVYVNLPDTAARLRMLTIFLGGKPLAVDVDTTDLAERLEGYSGADIRAVCEQTANAVFLEAVRTGEVRDIGAADFDRILGKIRPSVTAKELGKFEKFRMGE
jgi:transitional endoplasmic reticulum ATPase